MRVIVSRILLGAAIAALAICLVIGVDAIHGYQRAVAKGDFAGFSLGMFCLRYALVPLTLSLFVGACLLDPPAWLLRQLRIGASPSKPFKPILRRAMIVPCLAGAAGIFLYVAIFVGGNLVSAARHYGYGGRGLAMVLLQNVVFSSPMLILGGLLAWGGRALQRSS